jgi:hypothetical protein
MIDEEFNDCQGLLDNLREGFQVIDFQWRYVMVNEAILIQSNVKSKHDLVGQLVTTRFPGIEGTPMFLRLKTCMDERKPQEMETEFIFPDDSVKWFDLRIYPCKAGICILSFDITERKQAEKDTQFHLAQLEEMIFMTSHKVRPPVAHMLGFSQLLETTKMSQEELNRVNNWLKSSIRSLDTFTKELGEFLNTHRITVKSGTAGDHNAEA